MCMLSPLLYSLFPHACMARHDSNTIIKCAYDTTVVGLITNNDETAYREEVRDLTMWCQDNNLFLNVVKTKEMIVDYRKMRTEHVPILINAAVVEQIESFKFLGILTGCITALYGNCSVSHHKALQRAVHTAG